MGVRPRIQGDATILTLLHKVQKRVRIITGAQLCHLYLMQGRHTHELSLADQVRQVIAPQDRLVAAPTPELAARSTGIAGYQRPWESDSYGEDEDPYQANGVGSQSALVTPGHAEHPREEGPAAEYGAQRTSSSGQAQEQNQARGALQQGGTSVVGS